MPPRRAAADPVSSTPAPIRRNPPRQRRAPPHPDSPVTYALPNAGADLPGSSDDEYQTSSSPLANPSPQEREPSVEVLDSPPGHAGPSFDDIHIDHDRRDNDFFEFSDDEGDRSDDFPESIVYQNPGNPFAFPGQENRRVEIENNEIRTIAADDLTTYDFTEEQNFMARVDVVGLTYRERIELLIGEVERMQGTAVGPASDVPPGSEHSAGALMREEAESGAVVVPQEVEEERALYLINVHLLNGRRTFVQILPALPPDTTIIERLSTGMLSRMIGSLDRTQFYIATADVPVDVSGDYMNWIYNFRELGTWQELEDGSNEGLSLVRPVPNSPARTALLAGRQMSDGVPVYAIYIYHQDVHSSSAPAIAAPALAPAPATVTLLAPAPVSIPGQTPAHAAGAAPTLDEGEEQAVTVDPEIARYLRQRFANRLERIVQAGRARCAQAYRHCMQEKNVMAICDALGLDLTRRSWVPVNVPGGLVIGYSDVVVTAGLVQKTFSTVRTAVDRAREARRLLARYFLSRGQGEPRPEDISEEMETQFRRLNDVLKVMLVESDIDESFLHDESGSAEAEALNMSFATFQRDVNLVRRKLM
ncbi:hypothetical protein B0H19DRAFT_1263000 [Mycena capillaripes]|nr:hypothetical protein B0H19DRAFT_1263000 [Mycena capillaripes]